MTRALPLGLRTKSVLFAVSVLGLAMFLWPLWISPSGELAHNGDAAIMFAGALTMLIVVLGAEIGSGGIDAKALAMLGVLSAVAAALRPLGPGATGFQPMFVVLILGGRALGPGFGFALGLVSMFGSALLTGGVGPWLPFQMLAAGWVGMGAGLLPRAGGRAETAWLCGYGAVSGVLYGFLMNMWFWPFLTTAAPGISFVAGLPVGENLARFFTFCLITSLGFDIPRAIGNVVILLIAGPPLLRSIRRVARRANFAAAPLFAPSPAEHHAQPAPPDGNTAEPAPPADPPSPAERHAQPAPPEGNTASPAHPAAATSLHLIAAPMHGPTIRQDD